MPTKKALSMPPVNSLRTALALVASSRVDDAVRQLNATSTDQVRRWARQAQSLSTKCCFFCETKRTKKQNGSSKNWDNYVLCGCMAPLLHGARLHYPWTKNVLKSTSADLTKLIATVAAEKVTPETTAYSNDCCGCHKQFSITVGQIVRAAQTHELNIYRIASRCKTCRSNSGTSNAAHPTKSIRKKIAAAA